MYAYIYNKYMMLFSLFLTGNHLHSFCMLFESVQVSYGERVVGGWVSCWPARTVAGVCTNKFLACIFVVLVHDMHRVCDASAVHQRPLYINSSNNSQLLILPPELKPREREREMSQWWN